MIRHRLTAISKTKVLQLDVGTITQITMFTSGKFWDYYVLYEKQN